MNNVSKLLGASILGLAAAGCATKIKDIDPKLEKYHSNDSAYLSSKEARLFWELEFDKNHNGKLENEELISAFDYLSSLPDTYTRNYMFKALADFRKESLEKK